MNFLLRYKKIALAIVLAGAFLLSTQLWHGILTKKEYVSFVCNTGIGLGIEINPILYEILWIAIVGALVFFAFYYRKSVREDVWLNIAFLAIVVGAISNKLDRFFHGCVIDYIPFFQLFTFNIADTAISIGAIVLLLKSDKLKSRATKKKVKYIRR